MDFLCSDGGVHRVSSRSNQDARRSAVSACAAGGGLSLQRRSATPFGINAALALAAVVGGLLLPQYFGELAGRLLAMQFLVVHAIAMLYGFAWWKRRALAEGKEANARLLTGMLWVMYAAYPLAALSMGGLFGLVEFAALASGTFLGAWDERHGRRELFQIGAHWAVAFLALMIATNAFGLPKHVEAWPGAYGSVAAAGLYFGALAAAEAAPRFYRRLVVWMRWLAMRARRLNAGAGR